MFDWSFYLLLLGIFCLLSLNWGICSMECSSLSFCNKHAISDVFLIYPKSWVFNKLFLLFTVVLVLRRTPEVIVLTVLIILGPFFICLFCLLFLTLLCFSFDNSSIHQYVMVFRMSQLQFQFLYLFYQLLFFSLLLKHFMVLLFYRLLHFSYFFLHLLILWVYVYNSSFIGYIRIKKYIG
jgi:hypothetical protein